MVKKSSILLSGVLIFAAMVAAYANHFHNSFHFDDFHTIVDNASIRNLKNIPHFFVDCTTSSSLPSHQGYRPLVTTLSAINFAQGGQDPFWYHVSNFGIFALITLLFYFFQKEFYSVGFALLGCAWYGLSTVNAETVNYLISRSDILSTICILGSFVVYLSFPNLRKTYLYLLPAMIGMFAKETTVMFAPALVAYHFYFDAPEKYHLWKSIQKGLVALMVCVFLGAFGIYMTNHHVTGGTSTFLYFLTQPYMMLHYVTQFFFPFGLTADTDQGMVTFPSDERIYIGFTFVIGMVILIFKMAKKAEWKPAAFGLSWFFLMLLPTSSFIAFSEVNNDHRMFLPDLGLVLALMCIFRNVFSRLSLMQLKYVVTPLLFFCLSGYAFGIHERNKAWLDEKTLWKDVTEKSPRNGRAWMNYGLVFMAEGQYEAAENAFTRAQPFVPNYFPLYVNFGIVMGATNRDAEAVKNFERAISLDRSELEPYFFYARYLNQKGKLAEAEVYCKEALHHYAGHLASRHLMMDIYSKGGKLVELAAFVQETLKLYPNDPTTLTYLKH